MQRHVWQCPALQTQWDIYHTSQVDRTSKLKIEQLKKPNAFHLQKTVEPALAHKHPGSKVGHAHCVLCKSIEETHRWYEASPLRWSPANASCNLTSTQAIPKLSCNLNGHVGPSISIWLTRAHARKRLESSRSWSSSLPAPKNPG